MDLDAISFTPELVYEIQDMFSMFDKDCDNCITINEFGPLMRTLGLNLSDRELKTFFTAMDESGDGLLEFDELIEFLKSIVQPTSEKDELEEAFKCFIPMSKQDELPPKAVISKTGLAKILEDMGEVITEAECEEMIQGATGGRKTIDFKAFMDLVGAGHAQPGLGSQIQIDFKMHVA